MFIELVIMYTHVFIIILITSSCFCYAGYELFQGFLADVDDISETTTGTFLDSFYNSNSEIFQVITQPQQNPQNVTILLRDVNTTSPKTPILTTKSNFETKNLPEIASLKPTKFDCPEEERPSNIGTYEIPTQQDLVLFTKNILLDMFNSYSKQAFYLLKDIRAATKATLSIEKKCGSNKITYKKCVKLVSKQCQEATKNIVKTIENRKQKVSNLLKVKICNLSEITTDPIETLKLLAQDKVYLEFALPGFLRLLSACSLNCVQSDWKPNYYKNKPKRHMTDQDLVIKHFLTGKTTWNS